MKAIALLLAAIVVTLMPSVAAAQAPIEAEAPKYDRWQEFLNDTVRSPLWWLEIPAAGAIDQAANEPEEWSGGDGYAKRNASSALKVFTVEVIDHAVAATM